MTTELVPSFLDSIDQLPDDLPGIQIEPGKVYWYHGADAGKIKAPGVFFGKEAAFTTPPPPPWETDDRFLETDGAGYSTPRLRLAIIGWRDQWFIPGATKNDKITWLTRGERVGPNVKIKKQVDYLVLIDGLADPMVLAVSGYYKSRPMEDIVRTYERGALSQLMRQYRRTLPRWSHWLTIGGRVDANGRPVLEKATDANGDEYGSIVTPPTLLAAPALVDAATMQLGIDTYTLYKELGWFKFQRSAPDVIEGVVEVASDERLALPPARNVPQAIEVEEDLPF